MIWLIMEEINDKIVKFVVVGNLYKIVGVLFKMLLYFKINISIFYFQVIFLFIVGEVVFICFRFLLLNLNIEVLMVSILEYNIICQ